jgi:hypothetical protein
MLQKLLEREPGDGYIGLCMGLILCYAHEKYRRVKTQGCTTKG